MCVVLTLVRLGVVRALGALGCSYGAWLGAGAKHCKVRLGRTLPREPAHGYHIKEAIQK